MLTTGTARQTTVNGARSPVSRYELPADLVRAAREDRGDARARLIEQLMPLVGSVARNYRGVPGVERSELRQEGVVGLLRALDRYDLARDVPFWAYAVWWVRQAMQRLVAELARPTVLSDRALRQLAHIREAQRDFVRTQDREPSTRELASASGMTMRQLQSLTAAERTPRALDSPVGNGETALGELVPDPCAEDSFEEAATQICAGQIAPLFAVLTGRERRVIEARFGIGAPERTLRELGAEMRVSAERIRQIEHSALETLRAAALGRNGLRVDGEHGRSGPRATPSDHRTAKHGGARHHQRAADRKSRSRWAGSLETTSSRP
ncbi:MAG TPA: sigma-70 family RNA polymerase sigma factor [Solirubrobacteraceae bacterium]|jgi:RNA polymerase sigma factor (sigma-70 family)|nr:sigma-70 family RNA polymerase sigma factor [Solirubrobacteraceae bacterium]